MFTTKNKNGGKNMCKKSLSLFLALVMLMFVVVGCNNNSNNNDSPAGTTPEVTTTVATTTITTKPEEAEKFYTEKIIKGGKTEYTIVYDKDDSAATLFATNLKEAFSSACGVTVACKPLDDTSADIGNNEIVIGSARKGIEDVKAKTKAVNDFAMKLNEKSLVLYATGHEAYSYMLEYLKREVLSKVNRGDLTLTSDDNIVYSTSSLKSTTFTEYWLKKNTIDANFLYSMFEPREYESEDDEIMPYRLYVPMDYDATKKYPVLIFLHGAGERGDNNAKQLGNLLPRAFSQANTPLDQAIIIAPQCPTGQQWVNTPWAKGDYRIDNIKESDAARLALEILDAVAEEFSTDDKRYYITGLSMGGFGTWDIIMRHSEIFAGAVPICGGADSTKGATVKDVPIWTVHDPSDPTVPYSGTKVMVDAIKAAGGTKIKFDSPSGYGHGSWNYVANSKDIYKWLFEQTK